MTRDDTDDRNAAHGDAHGPTTSWGYSLAAAAVCLGSAAVIVLLGLFG